MISGTVIGNIGRDAETRDAGGTPVVSFNVASTEKTSKGETTTWVKASWFGTRGTKLAQYLVKGKKVAIRGSMSLREYTSKDGTTKSSLEMRVDDLEFAGGKNDQASTNGAGSRAAAAVTEDDASFDPDLF